MHLMIFYEVKKSTTLPPISFKFASKKCPKCIPFTPPNLNFFVKLVVNYFAGP